MMSVDEFESDLAGLTLIEAEFETDASCIFGLLAFWALLGSSALRLFSKMRRQASPPGRSTTV